MKPVLGHNQFIGVSHVSEDRGREKERHFSRVENIYLIAETASELGFRDMMIETHPRMLEFLKYYDANKTFNMGFFLQVPYVQGYIQRMNQDGLRALSAELVDRGGYLSATSFVVRSSLNYLRHDYRSIGLSALQFELAPFEAYEVRAVLLHNIVTDLLLGLGALEVLEDFSEFVKEKLARSPGLTTQNLPLLEDRIGSGPALPDWVMTPLNPAGHGMNPSKTSVEKAIGRSRRRVIAMDVLGGGSFAPSESIGYVRSLERVQYAVFGASSRDHLEELSELLKET